MLGDDGIRSQYVPPRPTVKILKRPTRDSQGSGDGPLVNGDKPKQPIKSLKQVYLIKYMNYKNVIQYRIFTERARVCGSEKKNSWGRKKSRGEVVARNK